MQKEFETQILDIDPEEMKNKLIELGAKADKEKFQRRWVFDINPNGCHEWVRIRTDGEKTTVCYKSRKNHSITGTEEIEVKVDDFDKTAELFSKLSFYFDKFYQEDIKQDFFLDGIEFKIDRWPMIPPMMEIEATSEEGVKKGLKLLGLTGKDIGHYGHVAIYKKYGLELHDLKELKFDQ